MTAATLPPETIVLAFDFGTRRIGVAVGNTLLRQARALATIEDERVDARFARIGELIGEWQPGLLVVGIPVHADGAEHDLYLAFQKLQPIVDDRCAAGDFAGALLALASAKPAVDRFFDDVLVMADDPAVRANRLALLRGVAQTMNRAADISKLAT